jgi:hypothetical protein
LILTLPCILARLILAVSDAVFMLLNSTNKCNRQV